ncbi:7-cyano-7-deazaguanine synthase [Ectothiorhodospira shaposhnikovii]|uniref:7-cyano-7-deazaguanine synthase n=1 Tax=Ectothiorhodospira shaposhnikovii TaxID=1054 RepID=UPI0019065502|nr:7-cyano-7-deazaguanine synthase [Ectothiorhodospira shaposhnikovii]
MSADGNIDSKNKIRTDKIKNVLWTGGWDSTFRVLDLVLRLEKRVQPFYLIDNLRNSADIEQETMERIRGVIGTRSPKALSLIDPLNVITLKDMDKADDFKAALVQLRLQGYLGKQYPLIARLAQEYELKGLELSVHRDDKAYDFIRPYVERIRDGDDEYFVLMCDAPDDVRRLFGNLVFPVLELSKLDMEKIAKEQGYSDILEETWFCHNPTRKKTPCGVCNPCVYTIEEGLSRRIPLAGRVRYRRNQLLDAIDDFLPKSLSWRFRRFSRFLR